MKEEREREAERQRETETETERKTEKDRDRDREKEKRLTIKDVRKSVKDRSPPPKKRYQRKIKERGVYKYKKKKRVKIND